MTPSFIFSPAFAFLGMVALVVTGATAQKAAPVQIHPLSVQAVELLRAKCVSCHSSTLKSGGIDFSTRISALATGAFAPGNADGSKLVKMVKAGKMPPTGKLADADTLLLAKWVSAGAPWPTSMDPVGAGAYGPLWSLQPVVRYKVPHSTFDTLALTPIDHFLFARLGPKGLHPSAPASKGELLRRVTVDLTGLPPTVAEIRAFLADHSPHAYETVVDRLLASPGYGERWGRHWLDVVRYGESNGYEQNHLRPNAWPYRDYVIGAFNQDKPYPQFIAEQLAGDVLSRQDPSCAAATGFLVAGVHDTVGIQEEVGTRQQRSNDLDDIVSTTGATFLGLSVGCAKCHNHKFDPIPQKDYYRLTACFAGVRHGERPLDTPAPAVNTAAHDQEIARRTLALSNQIHAIEAEGRIKALQATVAPAGARAAVNARWNVDDFPPVKARFVRFTVTATSDGTEPCLDELQIFGAEDGRDLALAQEGARATASSVLSGFTYHRIDHLNDGRLGNEWSWISATPKAGWAQIELAREATVRRVVWSRDSGDIPRFDDRLPTAYHIDVSLDGNNWTTVATEAGRHGSSDYVHPDKIMQTLSAAERRRHDALVSERAGLEQQSSQAEANKTAYIGQFSAPDPIFVLRIGDVMQRMDPVTPGGLSCITGLDPNLGIASDAAEPERRLALARWIGNSRNPLTARVMVNRIWQYHFGHGLVTTPSDFGNNGVKPTHPELLDWLANDFMAGGWRIKRLQKEIVMSYVYRQTSQASAKGLAIDAGDQFLWRMPLRRMEGEAIRDAILQTSGKMDRRMGGPSYPLFQYRVVNIAIYSALENFGPETWRRSVYSQGARAIHDEVLSAFDCPESSQRAPRREATTTPLQALNLLNGPFMQQQSALMAERVRSEAGTKPALQVGHAFELAFGRSPAADERKAAQSLVSSQGLDSLCRVLMNANEFLYY